MNSSEAQLKSNNVNSKQSSESQDEPIEASKIIENQTNQNGSSSQKIENELKDENSSKEAQETESIVNPWNVRGKVDYNRLIENFGVEKIDEKLIQRFEHLTKKPVHSWIRRNIFFSHRNLNEILNAYEKGENIFLYTGRGPTSESMHIGNMIPFIFTKWLQDVFDCYLVIQMADDEKYYFKNNEFDHIYKLGFENAKDIVAFGFNPEKTFIFSNRDYRLNVKEYEIFVSTMKKQCNVNYVNKIFGFGPESTVGQLDWPFYQSAAAFSKAFPHIFKDQPAYCLVAYAIDQDPYFRMARDIAAKMNLLKPCSIMSTFIPPLTGQGGKMSSSEKTENATIFLTDSEGILKEKVMKYAYSGGGGTGTLEDHKKFGGNSDEDISYQYLRYFEDNEEKLNEIKKKFEAGEISCSEIKEIMARKLAEVVIEHQKKREKVTDKLLEKFYSLEERNLKTNLENGKKEGSINNFNKKEINETEDEKKLYDIFNNIGIKWETSYHDKIETMEQGKEIASKLKGEVCKNLLLKSKNEFILLLTNEEKVDFKNLENSLNVKGLKFEEKTICKKILKIPQGALSPFALINYKSDKKISVVLDKNTLLCEENYVNFHPLRNDATTTLLFSHFKKFLDFIKITLKRI